MTPNDQQDESVATLLIPDSTSQAALVTLFDALEDGDFSLQHRDGFDSRDAVAYVLTESTQRKQPPTVTDPTSYIEAYEEMSAEILSGKAYKAAINVLTTHMTMAVQHLIDGEAVDDSFDDPDRDSLMACVEEVEDQVTDDITEDVWNAVEVDA